MILRLRGREGLFGGDGGSQGPNWRGRLAEKF